MRNTCRDPCKCESGIGPFFQFRNAGYKEHDSTRKFADPEKYTQLLWVSHVGKSLDRLRTARQVTDGSKGGQRSQKTGARPVSHIASQELVLLGQSNSPKPT